MAHLEPKPQPYTFDLGALTCNDANPLPSLSDDKEAVLASTARDCAQGLINQLLTTCAITKNSDDQSLQLTLPPMNTPLPREKPVPAEKEKTTWQKFAEKKGIKAKKRDGKLAFDETSGEWKPKYGYKGKGAAGSVQADWIMEVDDKPKEKPVREQGDNERRAKKMKGKSLK